MDGGVGTEEPPDDRVVETTIHVDEAYVVQLFVPGEAVTLFRGDEGVAHGGAVLVSSFAPGVVASTFGDRTRFVGDGDDGAQVVGVEVAGFAGGGPADIDPFFYVNAGIYPRADVVDEGAIG